MPSFFSARPRRTLLVYTDSDAENSKGVATGSTHQAAEGWIQKQAMVQRAARGGELV